MENPQQVVYPVYVPLAFAILSGFCGALQQLSLKSIAELVAYSSKDEHENAFATPWPYLILLLLILYGFGQVSGFCSSFLR